MTQVIQSPVKKENKSVSAKLLWSEISHQGKATLTSIQENKLSSTRKSFHVVPTL